MQCTDDELDKMKKAQRELKKKEGQNIQLVQNSDSEISSSDEENLDRHRSGKKKPRQFAFEALEDPSKAMKEIIPGGNGHGHGHGDGIVDRVKNDPPATKGDAEDHGESAV
jgi:hypothetical protein